MKSVKKRIAVLLAVLMLVQFMPSSFLPAFGQELEFHEEINLGDLLSPYSAEYSTVQFVDWNGTLLEEKQAERGTHAEYTGNTPTRTGLTFVGWYPDPSEVVVQENASDNKYTAQYVSERLHMLTIYYVFAGDGSMAAHTYVATLPYGSTYSIASPEVVGFIPDLEVVTGEIVKDTPETIEITVTYTAGEGTPYKVYSYVQKLGVELSGGDDHDLEKYEFYHSEEFHATTNSHVTLAPGPIPGFTLMEEASRTYQIAADGSTEINVFYTRNTYAIIFYSDGGSYVEPIIAQYEAEITAPENPTKKGYAFVDWDKEFPAQMPVGGDTLTAQWEEADSTYMVHLWLENADDDDYTYYSTIAEDGVTGNTIDTSDFADKYMLDEYAYAQYFTYKESDGDESDIVIEGDGSTVVNVYFSRNVYTVLFDLQGFALNSPTATMTIGGTKYETGGGMYKVDAKFNANISSIWPKIRYVTFDVPDTYQCAGWGIQWDAWDFDYAWTTYNDTTTNMWDELCVDGGVTLIIRWEKIPKYFGIENHYLYYENPNGGGDPIPDAVLPYITPSDSSTGKYDLVNQSSIIVGDPYIGDEGTSYYIPIATNGLIALYTSKAYGWVPGIPTTLGDYGEWLECNIYFFYDRMVYNLDYINDDELYPSISVKYGELLEPYEIFDPQPPTGVSPNAQFAGWYTTKALLDGSKYDFTGKTMPPDNLKLYAKWDPPTYTVSYFEDEDVTTAVYSEVVMEGKYAIDAPDMSGEKPGYWFLGWFEESSIVAYQFGDQAVTGDLNLYAHWMQRTDLTYEVYYWDKETNALLSPELVGGENPKVVTDQRMESTVTEHAPLVTGYVPDAVSKSTLVQATKEKPDGSSVINFYYTPYVTLNYMVKYLDIETDEPVYEETDWITTMEAIVTVRAVSVPGYTPQTQEIVQQLVYDKDDNVIIFYYRINKSMPYAVNHFLMDPTTGEYPADYALMEEVSGPIGKKVQATEWTDVPPGYVRDSSIGVDTGYIASDGSLVLSMYYKLRDDVEYTVEHYLQTKVGGEEYVLDDTDNLIGTTGATAEYTFRMYEGFAHDPSKTTPSDPVVLGDGALVIMLYYDLNEPTPPDKTVSNVNGHEYLGFVREGDVVTFEISYDATVWTKTVTITDTLPAGTKYVSSSPEAATEDDETYTWTLDTGDYGLSGKVSITLKVLSVPVGGSLKNIASVQYDDSDDDPEIPEIEVPVLPGPTPTPTPEPTPEPLPTPEPKPTPEATPTPEPIPTPDPIPTPEPTPTPTPSPAPDPTPTPPPAPTQPSEPTPTPRPTRRPRTTATPTPEAMQDEMPEPTPEPTPIPGIDLDDPYIVVPTIPTVPPIRIGEELYEIGDYDVPLGGIGGRNVGDCPN